MQNFIDELSQRGVPAMHPQLCSIGLTAENLKQEVAVWQGWCNSLATNLPDVISSYLTMRDSYLQISNFYDACQAYHLQACLEASEMKKMMKIHVRWCNAVHEFTNDQVLQDVQQMEDFFGCSPLMLPYLNVVYCSQQFHEFLKDLSRTNPSSFRDLYGIIEQRLPHDAKNELILASLLEAQESMSPFLDREQSFSTVILKVREVHTKYQSLKVVNEHIEKIKQWFRDAEVGLYSYNVLCYVIYMYTYTAQVGNVYIEELIGIFRGLECNARIVQEAGHCMSYCPQKTRPLLQNCTL